MAVLEYETRGRWFSSGGSATVLREDGSEAGRVELEPGGLLSGGPTWTWHGAFGSEWELRAVRSSQYEVTRTDGSPVGTVARDGWLSSRFTLHDATGAVGSVQPRRLLSRDRTITLPDGRQVTAVRTTTGVGLVTSSESWRLEVPDDVTEPFATLLLAVPLVLDHQLRRQQQGAGA